MTKITAHIPTQQYGYIELADLPDDPAEIERLYNKYAEKPITLPTGDVEILEAYVGGRVGYDKVAHVYTNPDNPSEVYMSGSQYADSFRKPFDKQKIAGAMAAKAKVDPADIIKMWELKSQASRDLGSAIHEALQYREQCGVLSAVLGKDSVHDHPILKNAVESFIELHGGDKVESEALVVDHKAKRAGQIDRLVITGNKKCIIDDYKTGATIKDIDSYWKQLSFYAAIVSAAGWTVEKLRIHHYASEWTTYEHEVEKI